MSSAASAVGNGHAQSVLQPGAGVLVDDDEEEEEEEQDEGPVSSDTSDGSGSGSDERKDDAESLFGDNRTSAGGRGGSVAL